MNNAQAQAVKNSVFRIRTQSFRAQSIEQKNEMRALIAAQTAEYLERGEITVLPGVPECVPLPQSTPKPYPSVRRQQQPETLLTLPVVAEMASMSRRALEVLVAAGEGPAIVRRDWRSGKQHLKFHQSDVLRWIDDRARRRGL